MTIIDPNKEWVVDVNKFVSLGKNTPLAGLKLTGKVVATIYQGNLVYKDDSVNIGLRLMNKQACLVLADGSFYEGFSFGGDADTFGEVVFNTSMIGYQEMLTDPSYAGQILVPTYPLIGNYGINAQDDETDRIQVRGFVVREECLEPSHYLNQKDNSPVSCWTAGYPGYTAWIPGRLPANCAPSA